MSLHLRNWETVIPHHVYLHKKRRTIRIYEYHDSTAESSTFLEFNFKSSDEAKQMVTFVSEGRKRSQDSAMDFWIKLFEDTG